MTKIEREKHIVQVMIALYCRGKGHVSDNSRFNVDTSTPSLCPQCRELLSYAHARLNRCRYGNEKPSCTRCPVHCYKPAMREQICQVMRYSGPRMLLHDPIVALAHLWDFLRAKFS